MKKEYTQNEMEQILRNDAEIPESVDRRMKETYEKLGLAENAGIAENADEKKNGRRAVRRRRPRAWVSAAAAAAVIAGLGLTAFAAARALNVTVKQEDGKAAQQVSVAPDMSRRDIFIMMRMTAARMAENIIMTRPAEG